MITFFRWYLEAGALLAVGALAWWGIAGLLGRGVVAAPRRWLRVAGLMVVAALVAPAAVGVVALAPPRDPSLMLWSRGIGRGAEGPATSIAWVAPGAPLPAEAIVLHDRQLSVLGCLLAAGVLLMALRLGWQARRLGRWCRSLPVVRRRGRLLLCAADGLASPLSARTGGLAYVVVPTAMWADPARVRMVVAHEGCHLRRGDLVGAMALELLRMAFFWNPAAHAWTRLVRGAQELACDGEVARRFGRVRYGRCLVWAAEMGRGRLYRLSGALPMARGAQELAARLRLLLGRATPTRWGRTLAIAVASMGFVAMAALSVAGATAVADRRIDGETAQRMADRIRARTGFAVPVDDWVVAKLNVLVGPRRAWAREALARMEPVRGEIEARLAAAGLPRELLAVPFAESGFDGAARSSLGAVGVWQLMPATAQDLGLEVSGARDQRRDLGPSTAAAVALLRRHHDLFPEWPLAIAAYNSGGERVAHAIDRVGSRDVTVLARAGRLGSDGRAGYTQMVLASMLLLANPQLVE
jgi:hypothetical protein